MLKPLNIAQVNFALGDEIGFEGKNSRVFKAYDPQLNANLVIKRVEKARIDSVDQYFEEASLLYASRHIGVVPINYACQDDECIFLAMPFFQNGSLKSLMENRHLTVREIVVFSTQFLSALHHIHSKRLIHFDIKPDNILISDRREALLSDFGLTRQLARTGLAEQDRIYGRMIPPEAFGQQEFSNKFDIYQVGLTIYRMCVGDVSFYAQHERFFDDGELNRSSFRHAVVNGQFPNRSEYPAHIPQALRNTVRRCLSVDPTDRYQSAIDIVNDLAGIGGSILDWSFSEEDGVRTWLKSVENKKVQIVVSDDGSSFATTTSENGTSRRIVQYCLDDISATQIRSFLKGH